MCRRTKIQIFKLLVIPVFGYRWNDFMSNKRLLRKTITSIDHQRQFRLYGHVARYPEADPVSERDNSAWRSKSMLPVGSYLVMEGGLLGD